jgi:hypothetical protein
MPNKEKILKELKSVNRITAKKTDIDWMLHIKISTY